MVHPLELVHLLRALRGAGWAKRLSVWVLKDFGGSKGPVFLLVSAVLGGPGRLFEDLGSAFLS